MNNIALGRYMPLDSVVHKMDPRSKICIMLLLMITSWCIWLCNHCLFCGGMFSVIQIIHSICFSLDETDDVDDGFLICD